MNQLKQNIHQKYDIIKINIVFLLALLIMDQAIQEHRTNTSGAPSMSL